MEYLSAGATISSTYTTVLSATTNTKLLVKTIQATNTFSGDTSINLRWYDSSEATTYSLSYDVTIPQTASYQVLDGVFALENNDYLEAQTGGDVNSIDLTISYLEITNTTPPIDPISYVRENWKFGTTQFILHDLGWYLSNTTYFDYVVEGVKPVLSHIDETKLLTLNYWSNYERATNNLGGTVFDGSDGSIARYLVDNYSGKGYYLDEPVPETLNWIDSQAAIQLLTTLGFNDWHMMTIVDAYTVCTGLGDTNILRTAGSANTTGHIYLMNANSSVRSAGWNSNAVPTATNWNNLFTNTTVSSNVGTVICRNHFN